jgi:CHASE3 domain sensor protein
MGELAQLIMSIGLLITAIMSVVSYVGQRRNASSINQLVVNTNGIQKALTKVTGEAEYEKGVKQGKADQVADDIRKP